jgi:hypothetical protein
LSKEKNYGVEVNPLNSVFLNRLFKDSELFVNCLFLCVMDQCEKLGVTDEQFGKSILGVEVQACDAFLRAMADYCPGPMREFVNALVDKTNEIEVKYAS